MIVREKFFTKSFCDEYIKLASKNVSLDWKERVVALSNEDKVVEQIKNLFKNFNINLTVDSVEIQTWPVGSKSDFHVHGERCEWDDGRNNTELNTLVYLNDNFEGGEFFTQNIIIKPTVGTLTLFDGSRTYHGVKPVLSNERYTIILWWKK